MLRRMLTVAAAGALAACAHAGGPPAYSVADVDEEPALIACPEIEPVAADNKYNRFMTVRYGVSAEGRVVNAATTQAPQRGWEELAASAVARVQSCRYVPAMKDGAPVEVSGLWQHVALDLPGDGSWRASRIR